MSGPRLAASLAATWPTSAPPRQAAFSRDGKLVALSDASGTIAIRDARSWKVLRLLYHPGGATSVAFGKDGLRLFSGGYDGTVREWHLGTGGSGRVFSGAKGAVWTIEVSPDGKLLAAAGEDAIIRIWTIDGSNAPAELRGHTRNVWDVRFSPDGTRLASGSFDDSVRLWDVAGRPLKTLTGHSEAVVGLDFSPDGKLLVPGPTIRPSAIGVRPTGRRSGRSTTAPMSTRSPSVPTGAGSRAAVTRAARWERSGIS